jgi:hypothetical protein
MTPADWNALDDDGQFEEQLQQASAALKTASIEEIAHVMCHAKLITPPQLRMILDRYSRQPLATAQP